MRKIFKIAIDKKREFSSTQVQIEDKSIKEKIKSFQKTIPKKILVDDGMETDLHITVKYGLHTNDEEEVRELVKGFGKVRAYLDVVSYFEASEFRDNDVLKISVDSKDLERLNKLISKNLEFTSNYPKYEPHLTLAYIKTGEGKKWDGIKDFVDTELEFDSIIFSSKDSKKIKLSLL